MLAPGPAKSASPAAPDRPPPPHDAIPATCWADVGGDGGRLSTGGVPREIGPGLGPSMRQESVYTPTAQEGAARRGDGSRPSRWVASAKAVGGGPNAGVGRSHDCMGSSRLRATAAPCDGRSQGRVRGPPLPPPPLERALTTGRADRARRPTGNLLGWAARPH